MFKLEKLFPLFGGGHLMVHAVLGINQPGLPHAKHVLQPFKIYTQKKKKKAKQKLSSTNILQNYYIW